MKDLHLPLNQTQRVRFETALHELQMLTLTTVLAAAVTIADTIPVNHEDSILRGHWTSDQKGKLVSTLCGVVEWVDKLVHVRTLRARYRPEICDILVGRVSKIGPESWRLEINSKQDAVMKFSSINFPDVIQRRRTAVDELNARSILKKMMLSMLKFVLSTMMDLQSCNQWIKSMESLRGASCSWSLLTW